MAFLHGVETIIVVDGARPVALVKTSVIGIVGTAPKGTPNSMVVVSTARQGVEVFGDQLPGFTIPQALSAAFANKASRVIVINVFDPSSHTTAVVDENQTITNGIAKLTNAPTNTPVVTGTAGTPIHVAGTDYEIDSFGNLTVLNFTSIPEGTVLEISYEHLDASSVTDGNVIGTASPRTGFQLFEEAITTFGYGPKILISPTFCEEDAIAAEMIVQADTHRAVALIDAPAATTQAVAIAGRGPSGTLAGFQTSNKRTYLLTPYLSTFDPATNAAQNRPYSQFMAGVISGNENYWESPSNKEISGILGVERVVTAAINDPNSEANALNEVAITTQFSAFGTGIRTWGNRNASYPTNTSADSFLSVQRVADIVHESLELAMLSFIDRPINQALIDAIRQSGQQFVNVLIGRDALIQGSRVEFDPDDNPAVNIAAGQLTFNITFAAPTPAERITFKSFLDISLLSAQLS